MKSLTTVLFLTLLVLPLYSSADPAGMLEEDFLAAAEGDADAQYSLGWHYSEGEGVARDSKEAVKWFRLSVEQAHAGAQASMGMMYMGGEGVPQDYQEAAKWFQFDILP